MRTGIPVDISPAQQGSIGECLQLVLMGVAPQTTRRDLCDVEQLRRRLVLPRRIEKWSLTSLQQQLVKTGGRMIKHGRYYWLLLAESHLTKRLFAAMVRRIAALPVPAG